MDRHGNKTTNRDNTRKQILNPTSYSGDKNWLGLPTDSGAAQVCEMLIEGATVEQMIAKTKRNTKASVMSCISTLRREYGLPIIEDTTGKFQFDRGELGIPNE